MKEKWKVIGSLLEGEYHLEVQPSYEGWGSGYDPTSLPLTEMWMRGEVESIPIQARKPRGVIFYVPDLMKKPEDLALLYVRHEIEILLRTDFYLWRLGQREFFRFGYAPTHFLVLYCVLESIKTDEEILKAHPTSLKPILERYEEILKSIDKNLLYPYHEFVLDFLRLWMGKPLESLFQDKVLALRKALVEYLNSENREAYDLLMEEFFGKYRLLVESSQRLNYVDLLLEEARGKVRQDAHRGRIMTDLLKKLPQELQELLRSSIHLRATDLPESTVTQVNNALRSLPEWMRDYLKQMSYMDMVERDLRFTASFLPKTLETDIEHKGFLVFLPKPWEEVSSGGALSKGSQEVSRGENTSAYRAYLRSVSPYVESLKRKFQRLMPMEEELYGGKHLHGKRLNTKSLSVEVPIRRGKVFQRIEMPERKVLCFKLLMDVSSSMKREEKIQNALKALVLVSETLYQLGMPFSIDIFSDNVQRLKTFEEDYGRTKGRLLNLLENLGGTTDIGKALLFSSEDLERYAKENHIKGVLIVFSDGEPTRGLKGQELKALVREIRGKHPLVGVGVGQVRNYVEEYFDKGSIRIESVSKLPLAFSFLLENYLRRLEIIG